MAGVTRQKDLEFLNGDCLTGTTCIEVYHECVWVY